MSLDRTLNSHPATHLPLTLVNTLKDCGVIYYNEYCTCAKKQQQQKTAIKYA